MKLLEESTGACFLGPRFCNGLLDLTPRVETIEENIYKPDSIKTTKKICPSKNIIKNVKMGENICKSYM